MYFPKLTKENFKLRPERAGLLECQTTGSSALTTASLDQSTKMIPGTVVVRTRPKQYFQTCIQMPVHTAHRGPKYSLALTHAHIGHSTTAKGSPNGVSVQHRTKCQKKKNRTVVVAHSLCTAINNGGSEGVESRIS